LTVNSTKIMTIVAASLLASASTPSIAQTVVYYDSQGFEQPSYHVGRLAGETFATGQDNWVGLALPSAQTNLDAFMVQTSRVRSGVAAVKFDAVGQPSGTDRTELYRGGIFQTSHQFMELNVDLYIDAGTQRSADWVVAQQQTPLVGLTQMAILPDSRMRILDYSTSSFVFSDPIFTPGAWHSLRVLTDYTTSRATYWLDSQLFATVGTVQATGFYGLVGFFNDQPGHDALYIDNLRIVNTVPAPGATAALGVAAAFLGVRRRRAGQ
jgi:hypothetical protein